MIYVNRVNIRLMNERRILGKEKRINKIFGEICNDFYRISKYLRGEHIHRSKRHININDIGSTICVQGINLIQLSMYTRNSEERYRQCTSVYYRLSISTTPELFWLLSIRIHQ